MIKDFMNLSMEDKIKIISLGLDVLGFLISLTNVIILMYSRKVKLNFGIEQLRISPYYNNSNLASMNVLGNKKKPVRNNIPTGFNFYSLFSILSTLTSTAVTLSDSA